MKFCELMTRVGETRSVEFFEKKRADSMSMRKSYGMSSGRTYKTTGGPGNYRRVSYRKPMTMYRRPLSSRPISLFQSKQTQEWKNQDSSGTIAGLTTNAFGAGQILNGIQQGTSANARVGRSALFKSLQFRFQLGDSTTPGIVPVRVLIVYDKQSNGALPLITDILAQNNFTSPMNLDKANRFLILCDKIFESPNSSNTVGQYFRKMSLETMWSGIGATIADITTGAIVAFAATPGQPTTGLASIIYTTRVRYLDS